MDSTAQELCDRIDGLAQVVAFLGEALCGEREVEFSNAALAGARNIFLRVEGDLGEVRKRCVAPDSMNSE
jgi:hypothetical protein